MVATSALREIESQSAEIIDHIEFIRDNSGVEPFAGDRATLRELLELVTQSQGEFRDFADSHVPIYIGRCIIDELKGHWSIESRKRMAMFGNAYVNGFGNIDFENLYLPFLHLSEKADIKMIEDLWKQVDVPMTCGGDFVLGSSHSQASPRIGVRSKIGVSSLGYFRRTRFASRSIWLECHSIRRNSAST